VHRWPVSPWPTETHDREHEVAEGPDPHRSLGESLSPSSEKAADHAALEAARMRDAADRMKDYALQRSQVPDRAQAEPPSSDTG
jgi:hypothetical protein